MHLRLYLYISRSMIPSLVEKWVVVPVRNWL